MGPSYPRGQLGRMQPCDIGTVLGARVVLCAVSQSSNYPTILCLELQ
jgi:hypothetical protein